VRKAVRRFILVAFVLALYVVNIAASGTSEQNAIAIASVVGLVLPFVYKLIPAAGHYMVAITVGVSVVVALVAMVTSGELALDHVDLSSLYVTAMSVYGLSQFVYATLTQKRSTEGAVS